MRLPGSLSASNRYNSYLMIFVWLCLLLHPTAVLAVPNPAENFLPVPPPKHGLMTESDSTNKNETRPTDNLLCTPFGACEPCPPEAMHEPFCQPFGNRRLMHCVNISSSRPPQPPSSPDSPSNHPIDAHVHNGKQIPPPPRSPPPSQSRPGSPHSVSEIPAWESCGRIPAKERVDFFEFVACNALFAVVALAVLFFRERRLRLGRARMLAARIGIGGGGAGGGGFRR